MTSQRKKSMRAALIALLSLSTLFVASFIPTLWIREPGMSELSGEWVSVYYENEADAAKGVFNLAEARAQQLAEKLGFDEKQDINVYVYDSLFVFQTKKYGFIAPLLGLDWYIGDNKGTNVLIVSPANSGKEHGYEESINVVLHEMAHAYNYVLNQELPLWLNEGVALYLSNGNPPVDLYNTMPVPSFEDIRTGSPLKFADIGGYDFAYTYVEYLNMEYGWDKVLEFMRTGRCEDAFALGAQDVYEGWVEFLEENYS